MTEILSYDKCQKTHCKILDAYAVIDVIHLLTGQFNYVQTTLKLKLQITIVKLLTVNCV